MSVASRAPLCVEVAVIAWVADCAAMFVAPRADASIAPRLAIFAFSPHAAASPVFC